MRFLLTTLLLIAGSAQAAQITLKQSASPAGTLVRLGDVATVTGRGAERLERLALMPSPVAGEQQYLSATAIRDMLAAQGEDPQTHYFAGAYRVRVGRDATQPTPSATTRPVTRSPRADTRRSTAFRVRTGAASTRSAKASTRLTATRRKAIEAVAVAAVQGALDQHINTDPAASRLAVRGVRLAESDLPSLLEQTLTAEWTMADKPAPGDFKVTLRTGDAGQVFEGVADLIVQPMRVVAVGPIPRSSLVIASMVRVEPTPLDELQRANAIGFGRIEQAIGRETRRGVRAGEVIGEANTQAPLMVSRGEGVSVTVGGGGVSVRAQAIAKQAGRHGDLIPIELADSGERVLARVVGPRRLAILSAGSVDPIAINGGLR